MDRHSLIAREIELDARLHELQAKMFALDVEDINDFLELERLRLEEHELLLELAEIRRTLYLREGEALDV